MARSTCSSNTVPADAFSGSRPRREDRFKHTRNIREMNMRIAAMLALTSLMAFAAPAFSQSFVGEWTATAESPGGTTSETLKVVRTASGYTITAKLNGAPAGAPEAGPGEEIVLDGDRFAFKRKLTVPGGTLVITYTGVVSGDTFAGTAEIGGLGKVPYTGVRIKHSK